MALLRSYSYNDPKNMRVAEELMNKNLLSNKNFNEIIDEANKKNQTDKSDYEGPSFDSLFQAELSKEE